MAEAERHVAPASVADDDAERVAIAFMAAVIEQLPDMVFVKDANELRFVHLNKKAEELIGHPRSDLIGKSDHDFFPVEQASSFIKMDREVLAGGSMVEIDTEPLDTPEGTRFLHTKKIPLLDDHGIPRYLLGISEDVTERHQEQLARAKEQGERVARVAAVFERRGLRTVYQPIVDLANGDTVGMEALARFEGRPQRPADLWFSEAAAVGRGVEMELLAVQSAIDRMENLSPNAYLSFNASPAAVCAASFRDLVSAVPGERLVIELTEHTGVEDYETLNATLRRLRSDGVRLAVDDAGAGYASLRHIINLRPDIIKVDVGITRNIDTDMARRAVVSALLGLCSEVKAEIVAEGIETKDELRTLVQLGCRYGQGFLLGRPTPPRRRAAA